MRGKLEKSKTKLFSFRELLSVELVKPRTFSVAGYLEKRSVLVSVVLRIEPSTSYMAGKHWTTEPHPAPLEMYFEAV